MYFKSFDDFYERMEEFLRRDPFRVSTKPKIKILIQIWNIEYLTGIEQSCP